MSGPLISTGTRTEYREALASFVLREIADIFEAGRFEPNLQYQPAVGGQRRTLVEQYLVDVDLSNPNDMKRLLSVFEELIFRLKNSPYGDSPQLQKTIGKLLGRMERDGFRYEVGRFQSEKLRVQLLNTPSIVALTEESIAEHVQKARHKIATNDFAGAITNSYTLVEEFLKGILRKTYTPFKENEGDIKTLYGAVADVLNLNPKGENFEGHLKTILQGLRSQIAGLYEVANKASDRHARTYSPARHHAKLAVNSAFTLCEFILDSYEYQQQMKSKKAKG